MLKTLVLLSSLWLLGGCAFIERLAIPEKKLIDVSYTESGAADSVSHTIWDGFLRSHSKIDAEGVVRVGYGSVSKEEHQQLKVYIDQLSGVDTARLSKDAQLAYWANLYNAKTVDVILDHYPLSSIRDVKDGILDLGPWDEKRLDLRGRPTSLHDIEHGIVRPVWSDTPEIHYILNCAAVGCPNLPLQAYTAGNIQELIREAAAAYVNDAGRGVLIDASGRVSVSKIYSWYREDFGGSDASILNHLQRYAAPALKSRLQDTTVIKGYLYDWSLNDTN